MSQAKPVLENANSTAEEIQKAQEDLENAIQALVKKADFSILNEKVQEGYAFLESDKDMLEEASYMNFKMNWMLVVLFLQTMNPHKMKSMIH